MDSKKLLQYSRNQDQRKKLSRETILLMVEENNGANGLNLAGKDLSGVHLEGIDLGGVNLDESDLSGAHFNGANLRGASLQKIIATGANFENANFNDANLTEAKFWNANFRGAWFRGALLSETILLTPVGIPRDNLNSASFAWSKLNNTLLTRSQIGNALREEIEGEYPLAKEIYLALKNNFNQIGRYSDASWAYQNERRVERIMHAPWRVRESYKDDLNKGCTTFSWEGLKFYSRHTFKWMTDWISGLLCGYGERPLRTILWALVILTIFPFLYWKFGGIESKLSYMTLLDYFNYSFGAFTTTGFGQFEAKTSIAQLLTNIEALLGIATLALLMFTLGNRISKS